MNGAAPEFREKVRVKVRWEGVLLLHCVPFAIPRTGLKSPRRSVVAIGFIARVALL